MGGSNPSGEGLSVRGRSLPRRRRRGKVDSSRVVLSELGCSSVCDASPPAERGTAGDLLAGNSAAATVSRPLALPGASPPPHAHQRQKHTPESKALLCAHWEIHTNSFFRLNFPFVPRSPRLSDPSKILRFLILSFFLLLRLWHITGYLGHITWCCGVKLEHSLQVESRRRPHNTLHTL